MTDSRVEVTVIPEDQALVDELCEMHDAGHAYQAGHIVILSYMVHDLSYTERCQKIAAYRESCEKAARDATARRAFEAGCFLCRQGRPAVLTVYGWRHEIEKGVQVNCSSHLQRQSLDPQCLLTDPERIAERAVLPEEAQ